MIFDFLEILNQKNIQRKGKLQKKSTQLLSISKKPTKFQNFQKTHWIIAFFKKATKLLAFFKKSHKWQKNEKYRP